jgi:hypothetical protein
MIVMLLDQEKPGVGSCGGYLQFNALPAPRAMAHVGRRFTIPVDAGVPVATCKVDAHEGARLFGAWMLPRLTAKVQLLAGHEPRALGRFVAVKIRTRVRRLADAGKGDLLPAWGLTAREIASARLADPS